MPSLPKTLNRKAVMVNFNRLAPVTWECLFEREANNGLKQYRVPERKGDYTLKAYYYTEGIKLWLIREGHYTANDFHPGAMPSSERLAMNA